MTLNFERTADDVIADMEHTRSMHPVSKDDAWILADALLELRQEITEERQQTRFAWEEAQSRLGIVEAEAVTLRTRNDQLHVAYIQASNPGADVAGIKRTLAEMRAVAPQAPTVDRFRERLGGESVDVGLPSGPLSAPAVLSSALARSAPTVDSVPVPRAEWEALVAKVESGAWAGTRYGYGPEVEALVAAFRRCGGVQ